MGMVSTFLSRRLRLCIVDDTLTTLPTCSQRANPCPAAKPGARLVPLVIREGMNFLSFVTDMIITDSVNNVFAEIQ